jgi:hypothetical protein
MPSFLADKRSAGVERPAAYRLAALKAQKPPVFVLLNDNLQGKRTKKPVFVLLNK